jgi:hypothetical protein
MVSVSSNIGAVTVFISTQLKEAMNSNDGLIKDKMIRAVASSMGGIVKTRVHNEGKNSQGADIGTYSNKYLKTRQKYNRTGNKVVFSLTRQMESDFGIVASDPIKTATGYGLGFKSSAVYSPESTKAYTEAGLRKSLNKKTKSGKSSLRTISNAQKAEWLQQRFGEVYKLTNAEKDQVRVIADGYVKKLVKILNKE